ncbi:MAG: type III restriction endonuclease subunit R [Leptonema illini]|uniref:Type III restriction endonuclease subunit R n=1 Tax=Leptonema illini TaxID=183 RepID=A0A833LUY1_9LEPT|nr:MAG: type III restriction endonuclease subunit R [Leptonema illini]
MNPQVNSIAGRLSLRKPQRRSLEILDRITEIFPPSKKAHLVETLEVIKAEFPSVTDFEREFCSLCFSLATGVGKTRLMGAFVAYLHLVHGIKNFFVLAPNLTIYEKLIADFTPNTPKYVFKGVAEFATEPPEIITGDDYEAKAGTLFNMPDRCKVNIFNISKINSEVRGGKAPRIKRLSEYIGESYFSFLAGLPDLVLLMDESHRYRASAGVRAINDLKPILGLELTATPFVETSTGIIPFKNVIYQYQLGQAMADGFVKEPAVVTRKDFNPLGISPEELEKLKINDGLRLHERIKADLETYARETGNRIVKPFVLIIARDITHAAQLLKQIQSADFFEGHYSDRVIQVDSSKTGAAEEEMIDRLLKVEHPDDPTEIVIHVNMLKEGWDVTNLYTIIPLRAANARTLVEQSIGRGLRLPYGMRTGVPAIDRLNIVAHDRFQEIVEDAKKSDSPIQLLQIELDEQLLNQKAVTVVSQSTLTIKLGLLPENPTNSTRVANNGMEPLFTDAESARRAQIAYREICKLGNQPNKVSTLEHLKYADVQAAIVKAVDEQMQPLQPEIEGIFQRIDTAAIVEKTVEAITRQSISIPRILVIPRGEVKVGFKPFSVNLESLKLARISEDLWVQHLRTGEGQALQLEETNANVTRLEDYIVTELVDYDDISYDDHADLLYELASQAVQHLMKSFSQEDTQKILSYHQREIARLIHSQMQEHYWEEAVDYETKISRGFTELKDSAYTLAVGEEPLDYRSAPQEKSNISRLLFGNFERCLYSVQKFDSDAERKLAIILERDCLKWFKPARGQFQIFYRNGSEESEYQPDFVAETEGKIYMIEAKMSSQMNEGTVLAKKAAAMQWCANASDYSATCGGKPWHYILIPHDEIADNMTIEGLAERFGA